MLQSSVELTTPKTERIGMKEPRFKTGDWVTWDGINRFRVNYVWRGMISVAGHVESTRPSMGPFPVTELTKDANDHENWDEMGERL